jgi:hypothetical protein
MSSEKFSYKNLLIQYNQENKKKQVMKTIRHAKVNSDDDVWSFSVEISDEIVVGDYCYHQNIFCMFCGNYFEIGPQKFDCKIITPANIFCRSLEHIYSYERKELQSSTEYFFHALKERQGQINSIMKSSHNNILRIKCVRDYIIFNHISEPFNPLRVIRGCLFDLNSDKEYYLKEMCKNDFEYSTMVIHKHPWMKKLIYSYLD